MPGASPRTAKGVCVCTTRLLTESCSRIVLVLTPIVPLAVNQ